ncbi:hypothetical protein [Marinobacter shengliensis]|uniref:hypothetical protein n=1 Tax=Marinobacter shengliensis TaxID=1389223 RepID=UPI001E3A81C3|nr:hypothetical protein [Marinobacter shengliensis]MCD1628294.1 hypothetical protein [Marinobacter shengliensis]
MDDLIERMRTLEQDHEPDGWPAVQMRDISALCDALEAARAQSVTVPMTRIAEKKIEQLGGDVCGVLVRNEAGAYAAVDKHGRVMWLDSWGEGQVEPAGVSERELFEQRFPVPAGIYWNDISEQYDAVPGAAGFDDVEIYHGQWVGWQAARTQAPASGEAVARVIAVGGDGDHRWVNIKALTPGRLITGDLLYTQPQPAVPEGWISMTDRQPTKSDEDCEGKIWLLWPDRRYFERVIRRHVSCYPEEFFWMPSDLKRPQPPAEQEGA